MSNDVSKPGESGPNIDLVRSSSEIPSPVAEGATETRQQLLDSFLAMDPAQRKAEWRRRIEAKELKPESFDPNFIGEAIAADEVVERRNLQHETGGTQAIALTFDELGTLSEFRYAAPDGSIVSIRTDYDDETEQILVWKFDEQGNALSPKPEVIGETDEFIIFPEELGNLPKKVQS